MFVSFGRQICKGSSSSGAISGTDIGHHFPETSPVTRPPQKLHHTASRSRRQSLHVVQSPSSPLPLSIDLSFNHTFLESLLSNYMAHEP